MNGPKTRTSGKPIHHFFFFAVLEKFPMLVLVSTFNT